MASTVDEDLAARAWVTSLRTLRARHLAAGIMGLSATGQQATIEDVLLPTPSRHSRTPVGSEAWVRLLGEGGIEGLGPVIW